MSLAENKYPPPRKFGTVFTDHMLKIEYDEFRGGWQHPEITKFDNIMIHPAAKVLHYATEIFEGMKAYRGVDGKIRLFRPLLNLERLNKSAERACLPNYNPDQLLKYLKKLINTDKHFIPYSTDGSLYIRPTLIGMDPDLSLCESSKVLLYIILSPCGSYFSGGFRAVKLYANPTYVRAWDGGCGDYKMGSNYAPTIYVQKKAQASSCDQVLWLYGQEEELTEVGTMSLFMFYINDQGEYELTTPPLEKNLILPGITRKSLLELAKEWNEFRISEKRIIMSELIRLNKEKRCLEMFGAGTACVVTPVSEIYYKENWIKLPKSDPPYSLCVRFFNALTDIQYGRVKHAWAMEIETE